MDEPLSNLDAKLRVQMRTEVSRIQQPLGTTTVYVTHDQTEAMTLGDRVAVMRAGAAAAGRHAEGALQQPAQHLRRRLHRLAVDELLRRADRGRQGAPAVRRRRRSRRACRPGARSSRACAPRTSRTRRSRATTPAASTSRRRSTSSSRWARRSTRTSPSRRRPRSPTSSRSSRPTPALADVPSSGEEAPGRRPPRAGERGQGGLEGPARAGHLQAAPLRPVRRLEPRSAGGLSDHPRRPPTGRGRRGCRPGGRHGILLSHLIPHRRAEIVRSSDRRP